MKYLTYIKNSLKVLLLACFFSLTTYSLTLSETDKASDQTKIVQDSSSQETQPTQKDQQPQPEENQDEKQPDEKQQEEQNQQPKPDQGEEKGKGRKPLQGQMSMDNALQILDALKDGEKELQDLRRPPLKRDQAQVLKDW